MTAKHFAMLLGTLLLLAPPTVVADPEGCDAPCETSHAVDDIRTTLDKLPCIMIEPGSSQIVYVRNPCR